MRWVAVISLRSNGEWENQKNITRRIAGRPLFVWGIEQAIASDCFDAVCIATEFPEICEKLLGELPGAQEFVKILSDRSVVPASGGSCTSGLLELQKSFPFDAMCLIEASCPLTRAEDFRVAKDKFLAENLDSLVTVVRSKRSLWTCARAPMGGALMKNATSQTPQGPEEYFMENGAFSITRATALTEYGACLGGRIGIHEMPAETAIEITEEAGWVAVELLLSNQKSASAKARARQVKALVLDVDGTLTDAGMYYGAAGEALKKFNTRDAHGLQLLREHGMTVCVITTEESAAVEARMKKLRIEEYYPGVRNKFPLLLELARRWDVSLQNIAYVGDDLSDLECLSRVGCAFCPADAVPQVSQQAHYICEHPGGHGAVREVCDLILEARESNAGNISELRSAGKAF
jgi:YrbI family 3-deoxy-D-manno-octulosonate 8-phosphate phosphatase